MVMPQKMFSFISSKFASCKLDPRNPSWQNICAVSPENSSVSSKICSLCSVLPWPALRRRFKYLGTLRASLLQQQVARRWFSLALLKLISVRSYVQTEYFSERVLLNKMSEMVLNTHTELYIIEPTVLGHRKRGARPGVPACPSGSGCFHQAYFALSTRKGKALKHILNPLVLLCCLENVLWWRFTLHRKGQWENLPVLRNCDIPRVQRGTGMWSVCHQLLWRQSRMKKALL